MTNNNKFLILASSICAIVVYILMKNISNSESPVYDEEKLIHLVLSNDNDILSTFHPSSPPIYFMVIRKENSSIKLRTACAIESASKHNPTSNVSIFVVPWNDYVTNILSNYTFDKNVKILNIIAREILKNTPLEKWFTEGRFREGKYAVTHLSDALRIATLWKYGGIYLDTDMWSVKSLTELRNTIGAENLNTLNGAAMMFDQFHPFLFSVMIEFVKKYNKNLFTVVGPRLLTDVMMKQCNVRGKLDSIAWEKYKLCSNVSVLPPNAFYPIDYRVRNKFFSNATVDWVVWWNSYTFHLWNQVTGATKVKLNSGSSKTLLEQIAETNCPETYKIMKRNGEM